MLVEVCKKMVRENSFCVLSTCRDNLTNSSLMLYLPDSEGLHLYMVTLKGSMKYLSMEVNPEVSLLIDTRERILEGETQVKALTVYGRSSILKDENEGMEIIQKLVQRHPSLQSLSQMKEATVVKVDIKSFLYLDGVNDAQRVAL